MGFRLPIRSQEQTEKVRLPIPASIHSWASDLAKNSGLEVEEVLVEAITYAYRSARKPAKAKKPRPATGTQTED
jgi:hypothetical protein